MKGPRQILRVSWTQKNTNEWVLETAGVKRELFATARHRKLSYYGHVVRKQSAWKKKSCKARCLPWSRSRGQRMTDNARPGWATTQHGEIDQWLICWLKSRMETDGDGSIARRAANARSEGETISAAFCTGKEGSKCEVWTKYKLICSSFSHQMRSIFWRFVASPLTPNWLRNTNEGILVYTPGTLERRTYVHWC